MWPFPTKPEELAPADPGRSELLPSQLRGMLAYGWVGSGRQEVAELFDALPPVSDVSSRVRDRLAGLSAPEHHAAPSL